MPQYATAEISASLAGRNARLSNGFLDFLGAAGELIGRATLNTVAGTVSGTTLTMNGMPKSVTPSIFGTAIATCRLRTSADVDFATGFTVGLAGSGAQVIVSKVTPASGDVINVTSCSLTES